MNGLLKQLTIHKRLIRLPLPSRKPRRCPDEGAVSEAGGRGAVQKRFPAYRSVLLESAAVLAVNGLALALAVFLEPFVQSSSFFLFMGAVVLCSWHGGRLAGLAAAAMGTWATDYVMFSTHPGAMEYPDSFIRVSVFAAAAIMVAGVNSARGAERRAEAARARAEGELSWLKSVLDGEPCPLLLHCPETQSVLFANRAAQRSGAGEYPLDAGTLYPDPAPADGLPLAPEDLPAARAARGETVEGLQLTWERPGSRQSLLINAQRVVPANGHKPVVVMAYQDVTPLKGAETALLQSESRYRILAEGAPVGIFHTDCGGHILYANDFWRTLIGAAPGDEPNEALRVALYPADRDRCARTWREQSLRASTFSLTHRVICPDHTLAWVLTEASPVYTPGGEVLGYVGTTVDVTAQKHAEGMLRVLADASALLASLTDRQSALEAVAWMALPHLGSWCAILVVEEGAAAQGAEAAATVVVANPEPERMVDRVLRAALPRALHAETVAVHRMQDWLAAEVPPSPSGPPDTAERRIEEAASDCFLFVPFSRCGKTRVALAVGERLFPLGGDGHVALAQNLASRIAAALENQRLYREARTAERQLRHQLDFTRAMTRSLGEGVVALDPEGIIIFANPAAAQLLNCPEEFLLGRDLAESPLFDPDEAVPLSIEADRPVENAPTDRRRAGYQSVLRRADGSTLPVSVTRSPILTEGCAVGSVLAFWDISRQKEEQDALRRLSEQRANLVSTVSHALRAPITAMLVNLELLDEGTLGEIRGEQKICVERALRGTVELGKTVDDRLTLSRLQDGRVTAAMREEAAESILREVLAQMQPRALSRDVILELRLEGAIPPIETDRRQLICVLVELVENAVKYSPPGGRVLLSAGACEGAVRVAVADEGPGIPPDEVEHIFQPFFRGSAATRGQVRGTGLGLQIVEQTAALLRTEVRVRPREPRGSEFELSIPVAAGTAMPVRQSASTRGRAATRPTHTNDRNATKKRQPNHVSSDSASGRRPAGDSRADRPPARG